MNELDAAWAYATIGDLEKDNERLTAENDQLRAEVQDLFTRNQTLVSENDKLQAKAQNQRDENAKLQKLMRANEKRAIDAKVELNEDVRKERAHVSKLQAENAKLRAQLAILIEGGEAADELIMMLKGIVEHTASSNKVTPPGQDAARQILAKINAYHEKYT